MISLRQLCDVMCDEWLMLVYDAKKRRKAFKFSFLRNQFKICFTASEFVVSWTCQISQLMHCGFAYLFANFYFISCALVVINIYANRYWAVSVLNWQLGQHSNSVRPQGFGGTMQVTSWQNSYLGKASWISSRSQIILGYNRVGIWPSELRV